MDTAIANVNYDACSFAGMAFLSSRRVGDRVWICAQWGLEDLVNSVLLKTETGWIDVDTEYVIDDLYVTTSYHPDCKVTCGPMAETPRCYR